MVFINSKKFACESCIKGHRSSNCHHNDRPLFEIKKKGRPVSQCEKCREARQARRIHAKCTCDTDKSASASSSSSAPSGSKKGKRFIPTVPALPNGLKDAMKTPTIASSPIETGSSRSQVDSLLNPCHCADVWNCKCRSQNREDPNGSRAPNALMVSRPPFSNGLSALAAAAACCSPAPLPPIALPPYSQISGDSAIQRRPSPGSHRHAKVARRTSPVPASPVSPHRSPLPPISPPSPIFDFHHHPPPPMFSRASTSTFTVTSSSSTRDDDCCCGHRCECEGCTKHDTQTTTQTQTQSGPSSHRASSSSHPASCGHDCPTCVDHIGGVELPVPGQQSRSPSFLDDFFARAATLPSPPPQSARSTSLDPTNVTVYPPSLFSKKGGSSSLDEQRGLAFGLVQVPKLEVRWVLRLSVLCTCCPCFHYYFPMTHIFSSSWSAGHSVSLSLILYCGILFLLGYPGLSSVLSYCLSLPCNIYTLVYVPMLHLLFVVGRSVHVQQRHNTTECEICVKPGI
ncbi:hypothetical protein SCHPADRAFT_480438 [Schizopora paradoxa]|uniref:Copper-fist domain-containing protein n=1 Tax=Schizopora paradoxa TaxID=27342 RepID=A0A0H2S2R7_9AGAM|nr:hypothetical protein SCHPADRAFT_480438 [Schizopora paradoxa]